MPANKPRFVDLGDKGGEFLLEGEWGQRNVKIRNVPLIDTALICYPSTRFDLFSDIARVQERSDIGKIEPAFVYMEAHHVRFKYSRFNQSIYPGNLANSLDTPIHPVYHNVVFAQAVNLNFRFGAFQASKIFIALNIACLEGIHAHDRDTALANVKLLRLI